MSYQVVSTGDVLYKGVEDGLVVIAPQHEVVEKLSHQSHIGNVLEEDGQVCQGEHHSTLRLLQSIQLLASVYNEHPSVLIRGGGWASLQG